MTPVDIELEPLVAHSVSVSKPGYKTMDQIIELKTVETLQSMAKDSEVINFRPTANFWNNSNPRHARC